MLGVSQSRRALRGFTSVLFLLTCGAVAAFGQGEAGHISGKVTDPSNAVVPAASVTIKSVLTGIARKTTSNAEGFYTVTSLQPGLYDVSVEASGFAARTQRAEVAVGSNTTINVSLTVSPVTGQEDVTESNRGVEINTQNQQQADLITGRQVRELPTITRDPFDLVSLSGNATPVNSRNGINTAGTNNATSRGISHSINGQGALGNNIRLDGGELANSFQAEFGQQLPLEAVQDIQVITNNYLPEHGRAIGGIINVATRQGSNEFSGSLFEFHRNRQLSTNSFENNALGIRKGQLVANQFGYSIGGPLIRDKVYFFNTTEGIIVRSRENQIALVPTPGLLAVSGAATRNFFNAFPLATPINGRVFTVSDVRSLSGPFATGNAFAALPATLPAFGQAQFQANRDIGAGLPQDSFLTAGRVDWTLRERHQIYARYALEHGDLYAGTFSASPFQGFDAGARTRHHSGMANWTFTLSPRWTSNSKISFTRYNLIRALGVTPATPRLLLTGTPASIGSFPVALPGFQPFNAGADFQFSGPENLLHLNQDFNTSFVGHQIGFGGGFFHRQDNRRFGAFQNATAILGANIPQALGNLLLGQVSSFQTAINPQGALPGGTITLPVGAANFSNSTSANDFSLYFNDNWRAHPRLTFNIGMRYDYFGEVRSRANNRQSGFFLGQGVNVFEQIQGGSFSSNQSGTNGTRGNGVYEQEWGNIAPRLGFAWDVFGTGRTALRGGYGITFQGPGNSLFTSAFLNPPNTGLLNFVANTGGVGTLPITVNNFGPLGGATGTVTLSALSVGGVQNFELETAHTHFVTLSAEHELFPNTVASVQYNGAAGRDLYGIANLNRLGSAITFLGGASQTARLNSQFGSIFQLNNEGRSNYHALIGEVTNSTWRRIGLQLSARYRFSRAMDNLSSQFGNGLGLLGTGFLNPFNPGQDYGPADFDIKHRFVGSFNWEVPLDRLTGGYARNIFGGWQVSGLFHARSGMPFSIVNCAGIATADTPCPRVDVVNNINGTPDNDNWVADASIANRFVYIDPTGFNTSGATGTTVGNPFFGTFASSAIGRNFFRGPGFWNIDAGLHKRFRIVEDVDMQFRAEFYNIFNHANAFVRGNEVDISSTSFVPGFKSGRRHIQLALKLTF